MLRKFINSIFCILPLLPISWCQFWLPVVRSPEEAKGSKFYALDFIALVEKLGLKAEQHNVTTEDGYILDLFKVLPRHLPDNSTRSGPPVYIQHGLFSSSEAMIIIGDKNNLVYVLCDAGYEVWLGNVRGNYHGRRHQSWSPDESRFWDFSVDELALKDLPAMFDYILETTGRSKLTYVGISLGATLGVLLLSNRTEFNEKINLSVLFSPVVYWEYWNNGIGLIMLRTLVHLVEILDLRGVFEVFPPHPFVYVMTTKFCAPNALMMQICMFMNGLLMGQNLEHWDKITPELFRTLALYMPAGTSMKVLLHYHQHILVGKPQFYDHRNDEINLRYYGQKEAPEYNMTNIVSPLAVFHGASDLITLSENVQIFLKKLPATTPVIYEEVKNFSHSDFLIAKNAKEVVYGKLLKIFSKFVEFP